MLAALGAGRVSAVEHGVPSFFEANVAENLRLERLERRRFPPQLGFHSNDLLLEFRHFRVREKSSGGAEATASATFSA